MRTRVAIVVALLLAAAVVAWWLLRDDPTDHRLTRPEDLSAATRAIAEAVPDALRESGTPGAEVAVTEDGEVAWSQGFGVDRTTVLQAGSISKSVAAAAVLTLAEEGLVDLDTPVTAYLRTWSLPGDFPDPDAVTLRRLLSHTAGIGTPGYLGRPAARPLPTTAQALDGIWQSEEVDAYAYSGGGFTIAQEVVEEVTGEPFAETVGRTVLAPLGMTSSGYACTQGGPEAGAGYRYAEAAAAGLCTTADDLARFAAWLGSDDPRAVAMRAPAAGTGEHYGLGTEIDGDTVGHLGVNRGFHAELRVDPAAGVGLVVLTNGDRGGEVVDAVFRAWHDAG
ncbi:serine hydrolase domain-containing protein [Nocardioides sp. LHD-245]|uniref:serine hydrolase domain-containing protein n=1 Tax=Nocardioides sp. LHD-245 TaxID=3051387 RepID=UPI0027DF4E6F|nr:serine hydrolase domain-containing protein [Nocardioides sp. LHD-245]